MYCHTEIQDITLSVATISEASQELKWVQLNMFHNVTITQGVMILRLWLGGGGRK
jgi:hypothetical protein